ncbi:hypothetical protein [Niastella vici]|uniref:hypothetical protein n=1 Tax=Niastella vici TaxID=1703345 RepID=UPI00117C5E53|nr:hypothetical protein [Niastella vici]
MKGSFTQLILLLFLCPYITRSQSITPNVLNVTGGSAVNIATPTQPLPSEKPVATPSPVKPAAAVLPKQE